MAVDRGVRPEVERDSSQQVAKLDGLLMCVSKSRSKVGSCQRERSEGRQGVMRTA